MDEAKLKILQMIHDKVITAAEGERLLAALDRAPEGPVGEESASPADPSAQGTLFQEESAPPELPPGPPAAWQSLWIYPALAGLALLAIGGTITGNLTESGHRLGWLACTIPLMLLGLLVAGLAWWSRTARWLHLSVREKSGKVVRIHLPLPLRFAAWVLRLIGPWIPQLKDTAVDELLISIAETNPQGSVLVVEVDEGKEGEKVQVYIG